MRQAEVAMQGGQLDEAYRLVQSDSLRTHRRGQALISQLVKKFLERSKSHLTADRAAQALIDCEKAQTLGGNREDVLKLRSDIEAAIVFNDRARRATAQAGMIENAAQLVDSALGRRDLDRATAELIRVRGNMDHRLRELDGNVRTELREQIEKSLEGGRLDQAQSLCDRLRRLDPDSLQSQQLRRSIEQLTAAWAAIENAQFHEAKEILARVTKQLPQAVWISETLEHVKTAENSLAALRVGPLGFLNMSDEKHQPATPSPMSRPVPGPVGSGSPLPDKFLLQIDGAGSYLILRKSHVTLGPISSSRSADVALVAEPSAANISIERLEDDYFLRAANSSKLLASGDRISLSPRCTLTFTLPNPSSTTATLELVAGRFPRADIRRVILLDQDLIIGPSGASHIRADHLTESVVMQATEERLICNGQSITLAVPTRINGISMIATATT
jgi:tetratricopeptide (TPR) repeat protein